MKVENFLGFSSKIPLLKKSFSVLQKGGGKYGINFFLQRYIPQFVKQEYLWKLSNTPISNNLNNVFNQSLISYNIKILSSKFSERTLVITLYMIVQQFKMEKKSSSSQIIHEFISIFQQNLGNIKKHYTIVTILFNFYHFNTEIPEKLCLQTFEYGLALHKKSYLFKDDGLHLKGLVNCYFKFENRFNFQIDFIEELFDYYYENWRMIMIDSNLEILKNFMTSKFVNKILNRLIKAFRIFDELHKYFSFEDLFIILSFAIDFASLSSKEKFQVDETKKEIYEVLSKILKETLNKGGLSHECKNDKILTPKEYYFTNKSIVLKNLFKLKELDIILKDENQSLSNFYLNFFNSQNIVFTGKWDKNELTNFSRTYNTKLFEETAILNLINNITINQK